MLQVYGGDEEEYGVTVHSCRWSITVDSPSAEQIEKDMEVTEVGILSS